MSDTNLNQLETILMAFHHLGDELPPVDEFGITPSQVAYLEFVGRNPGSNQLALARELRFKPASVSLMVSAMVEKNWIKKGLDPTDARQVSLELSEAGRFLWDKIRQFRKKRLQKMLNHLSLEEQKEFIRLFKQAIETK